MSSSKRHPRRKLGQSFSLEPLDERQLLSAGMGSTFAIMPGSVDKAGQISSIQFKIDPSQFTPGRDGKIVLGMDVAADPSGNIKPQIVSIKSVDGRLAAPLHHSLYSASIVKANKLGSPISSAVLATLRVPKAGQAPAVYTVQVQGAYGTTGKYLVGFYLPGDVTGAGTVTAADLQTIVSKLGATPTASNYSFDADVNRDGKISLVDAKYASMNLGAKTTISPIVNVNLDPATDGPLHSRMTNFRNVHFTGSATPGATVTFTEVNNNSPGAVTKADATGNYSIMVPLGDGSNTFKVASTDGFGQTISGQIAPVTYTTNPPQVINNPSQLSTATNSTTSSTPSTG
jgi:hypothetical protein